MGFRVKARSTRSKVVRRWMKHINVRRRTMPAVLACNLHHVLDGPRQRQETPPTLRLPFFALLPHTLVCLLLPPPLYTRLTSSIGAYPQSKPIVKERQRPIRTCQQRSVLPAL